MGNVTKAGNFKWIEKDDLLKFDEKFIKNDDENSGKGYVLDVDVKYPKIFVSYIVIYHCYQKE